ncbi:hypothetical protein BJ912DRAFT_930228 [Pholiota molesta]|nr:hypothetical protein BJ912DRAFT_930228 [Pholiota molesta]
MQEPTVKKEVYDTSSIGLGNSENQFADAVMTMIMKKLNLSQGSGGYRLEWCKQDQDNQIVVGDGIKVMTRIAPGKDIMECIDTWGKMNPLVMTVSTNIVEVHIIKMAWIEEVEEEQEQDATSMTKCKAKEIKMFEASAASLWNNDWDVSKYESCNESHHVPGLTAIPLTQCFSLLNQTKCFCQSSTGNVFLRGERGSMTHQQELPMRKKGLTGAKKAQLAAARAAHYPKTKDLAKKAGFSHRKRAEKLQIKVNKQKKTLDNERKRFKQLHLKHTKLAESSKLANLQIMMLKKATRKMMKAAQARDLECSVKFRRLEETITHLDGTARALARVIAHSGCAHGRVGDVMKSTAKFFGITMKRSMSRRTVSRAVLEGSIAAMVQQGYELKQTDSCTLSGDSTSHRKINYDACHIALRMPDYASGSLTSSPSSTPSVRLLGVDSSINHSSDIAVAGWKDKFEAIRTIYNESPLSKQMGASLTLRDMLKLIKGMCGDHAANKKATAAGIQHLKMEEIIKGLGEEKLTEKPASNLVLYLASWSQKMVAESGGLDAWSALPDLECAKQEVALMDEIKSDLGREAYTALDPAEKREIDLFVWAGCCMHKDLNCFKAGNMVLMAWWDKSGNTPLITLANKQNVEILRKVLEPASGDAPMTELEIAALEASTRGGVKVAALAGAIFNNKDDKKGYGDSHVWHLTELVGRPVKHFLGTNNTRFNSHAEAAVELLINLAAYNTYLLLIKDKKKSPSWTNIELNVYLALQDPPTLTELAVLALYSQAVTHPYLCVVRGPGTENVSILDLKDFHVKVREFIQSICDNPDLLIGLDASPKLGSLDGKDWENPEFAPGGIIDTCSANELAQAWMPTTNDTNEGALGTFRVAIQNDPCLTLHQYNAQAMFTRNETQTFMDTLLDHLDHAFIMCKARELDSSKLEVKRRKAQVAFDLRVAQIKREKDAEKKQQEIIYLQHALTVTLVQSAADIAKLTVKQLDKQLDLLQKFGNDKVLPKTRKVRGLKPEKQKLLNEALLRYTTHLSEDEDRPELDPTQHSWEDEDIVIE